jgi:mRNA interferase YafQ
MRTIEFTSKFRRDYKRVAAGPHGKTLKGELDLILDALLRDEPLAPRHADHPLTGNWKDHRDCHVRPDLVLIYRKAGTDVLVLVRLGSHSELGL